MKFFARISHEDHEDTKNTKRDQGFLSIILSWSYIYSFRTKTLSSLLCDLCTFV